MAAPAQIVQPALSLSARTTARSSGRYEATSRPSVQPSCSESQTPCRSLRSTTPHSSAPPSTASPSGSIVTSTTSAGWSGTIQLRRQTRTPNAGSAYAKVAPSEASCQLKGRVSQTGVPPRRRSPIQ